MSRILTTHVGSLPRSQEVVDFIFSRENNHEYDKAEFDVCMKKMYRIPLKNKKTRV